MIAKSKMPKKILFVFDLDHTILSETCDYFILGLLSDQSVQHLFSTMGISSNWAHQMQKVFLKMKEERINIDQIKQMIQMIQFNPGFGKLFEFLRKHKEKFETLIISGANTLYIQWVLESKGIEDLFPVYYSNFAEVHDDFLIKIDPHHEHDCDNCDESQCKRIIIQNHFKEKGYHNDPHEYYSRILYVGDGCNDYCPGTIMKEGDILFPRKDFPLHQKLYHKGDHKYLQCALKEWETGDEILNAISKLI